jgi:hypothetical protein
MFLAEAFAAAARARAGLAAALPQQPLPQQGDHIEVPRLASGAAVAVVASENAVVQETDPTSALASSNKALISGQVDVSRQLLEFSRPGIDEVLALDLGNDSGLKIGSQLISGRNANGQTLGLANVPSINTVTYTSGTPTAAALAPKIWAAFQAIADSGGGPSQPGEDNYLIVVCPCRAAALGADQGQTSATPVLPSLPGRLVVTSGIRQNLGAGTNEDEVFVIARSEVFVALGRPVFQVFEQVGSGTQTVRLQSRQYAAAMFARQPKSIARISGTGLTPPVLCVAREVKRRGQSGRNEHCRARGELVRRPSMNDPPLHGRRGWASSCRPGRPSAQLGPVFGNVPRRGLATSNLERCFEVRPQRPSSSRQPQQVRRSPPIATPRLPSLPTSRLARRQFLYLDDARPTELLDTSSPVWTPSTRGALGRSVVVFS